MDLEAEPEELISTRAADPLPADEAAGEGKQRTVHLAAALVADEQALKVVPGRASSPPSPS
jgi:hypothetical protein